jgi:rubrerythrin
MDKPDFNAMSYEEIIQFCIELEQEAVTFYESLVQGTDDPAAKALYGELALMERGHEQRLEQLDEETFFETIPTKVIDLKTTDYLEEVDPGEELTPQGILILAAKREKATMNLYTELAEMSTAEPFLHEFFKMMAEEEAKHKYILEEEYEKGIMGEM